MWIYDFVFVCPKVPFYANLYMRYCREVSDIGLKCKKECTNDYYYCKKCYLNGNNIVHLHTKEKNTYKIGKITFLGTSITTTEMNI